MDPTDPDSQHCWGQKRYYCESNYILPGNIINGTAKNLRIKEEKICLEK
jgi:hypothetical protein